MNENLKTEVYVLTRVCHAAEAVGSLTFESVIDAQEWVYLSWEVPGGWAVVERNADEKPVSWEKRHNGIHYRIEKCEFPFL